MRDEIEYNLTKICVPENFIDGDGMEEMQFKPIVESTEKMSIKQLEDIVRSWIRFIEKALEKIKQKVYTKWIKYIKLLLNFNMLSKKYMENRFSYETITIHTEE